MAKMKLGIIGPSPPDDRDFKYKNRLLAKSVLLSESEFPSKFSLEEGLLEPRDQGDCGSCAAQTGAAVVEGLNYAQYNTKAYMSPAFIYSLRSIPNQDSGMYMRNVCKILHKIGIVPEDSLKYNVSKLAPKVKYDIPYLWNENASSIDGGKEFAYSKEASKYKIGEYRLVEQTSVEMKAALFSEKAPLLIAVPVYGSSPYKNRMWHHEKYELSAGGHAMAIIGWDDDIVAYEGCAPGAFKVRNSWGTSWGDGGYTWFPYEDLMTQREAEIERASEYPNHSNAQPMPWEIYAVIDAAEIVPDLDPEPIPDPQPNNLPWWVWAAIVGAIGLPIILGILMSLGN